MKLINLQNNQNFRWSLVDCLEITIFIFYICIIDFKNSNIDNSINSKTLCVCICLHFQSLFEHKVTIISHTEYVCWFTKVYKFVYLFLHNHCGHLLHNNNHYHFTLFIWHSINSLCYSTWTFTKIIIKQQKKCLLINLYVNPLNIAQWLS